MRCVRCLALWSVVGVLLYATALPADELADAKESLAKARSLTGQPEALAELCEKAYSLAVKHKDGCETAIEAMDLLADKVADQREGCRDKVRLIYEAIAKDARADLGITAGEALVDYLLVTAEEAAQEGDFAQARTYLRQAAVPAGKLGPAWQLAVRAEGARVEALAQTAGLVDQLLARLKAHPEDVRARLGLMRLYVTERDDPAAAAKFLKGDTGEEMKTYLPMALQDGGKLNDVACVELGEWYRSLSGRASGVGRPLMLRRARGYYEAFLARNPADRAVADKARGFLAVVAKDLSKLEPWEPEAPTVTGNLALVSSPAKVPGAESWTIETRIERGPVRDLAISPDGSMVALAGDSAAIRLLNGDDGGLVRILAGHGDEVQGLSFSRNGKMLVSAARDGEVRLWEVATGRLLAIRREAGTVNAMGLSPDEKTVALGTDDGTVILAGLRSARPAVVLRGGHVKGIERVAWSPDDRWIASGGGRADRRTCIWSAKTKRCVRTIEAPAGIKEVDDLAFSPDGATLAVAHRMFDTKKESVVALWDCRQQKQLRALPNREGGGGPVAFSPDGSVLAARDPGNRGGAIELWRTDKWTHSRLADLGGEHLKLLAWSLGGKRLCVANGIFESLAVNLVDAQSGKRIWKDDHAIHWVFINSMDWAREGDRLAMAYNGGGHGAHVWVPGSPPKQVIPSGGGAWMLALSPDGRTVVSTVKGVAAVRLWDAESGAVLRDLKYRRPDPGVAVWSPDSRRLVVAERGDTNGSPVVFDAVSGKMIGSLTGYGAEQYLFLAWSPNGRLIAGCGTGNGRHGEDVAIWNPQTGKLAGVLAAAPGAGGYEALAWAPTSSALVSAHGGRNTAWIWDLRAGRAVRMLSTAEGALSCVAWSPDGATIAAAGKWDGPLSSTVWLWSARTGKLTGTLLGHTRGIRDLAWGRNKAGRMLLASAGERMVRIWDLRAARPCLTLLPVRGTEAIAFAGEGHFAASQGFKPEEDLLYVVQTIHGQQTLRPSEFAARYGWKNDPGKVLLPDQ